MKLKLPDIKKALEMVMFLKEKAKDAKAGPINTKFALSENVWANASVKNDTGKVCLWLGADTMVEYPYDEAIELLKKNLANAEKYIESVVPLIHDPLGRRPVVPEGPDHHHRGQHGPRLQRERPPKAGPRRPWQHLKAIMHSQTTLSLS